MKNENVAIIGASDKSERYSHQAMLLLKEYNHTVFLISPNHKKIDGQKVYTSIDELSESIDTVTMYISKRWQTESIQAAIIKAAPKRVIFNPGTENIDFERKLAKKNIKAIQGCTLVMLKTDQF